MRESASPPVGRSSLHATPSPAALKRKSCESKPVTAFTVEAENVARSQMLILYMSASLKAPSDPSMPATLPDPLVICAVAGNGPASPPPSASSCQRHPPAITVNVPAVLVRVPHVLEITQS